MNEEKVELEKALLDAAIAEKIAALSPEDRGSFEAFRTWVNGGPGHDWQAWLQQRMQWYHEAVFAAWEQGRAYERERQDDAAGALALLAEKFGWDRRDWAGFVAALGKENGPAAPAGPSTYCP